MKCITIVLLASVILRSHATVQEVSLNGTLAIGKIAAPNQVVNFTCVTRGASTLSWSSTDYIGMDNEFQITSFGDAANQIQMRGTTFVTRVDTYDDNGVTVIVSQLQITALEQFPTSSVTCRDNGDGPNDTINFITTEMVAATTSSVVLSETESATTRASSSDVPVDDPQQQNDSSFVIYVAAYCVGGFLVLSVAIINTIVVCFITKERRNESENSIELKTELEPDEKESWQTKAAPPQQRSSAPTEERTSTQDDPSAPAQKRPGHASLPECTLAERLPTRIIPEYPPDPTQKRQTEPSESTLSTV